MKKSAKDESPEEEQIKKLKVLSSQMIMKGCSESQLVQAMVFACGVRKSWVKELKGLDTPTQQISHIRGILSGLGMKGRFSLEQAKSIKAKRELAQEMGK